MAVFCEAEEGGDAVASLTDGYTTDAGIGSTVMQITNVSVY